jgi:hypothetical protein
MKLDLFELRTKDIHFTPVLEDNFIVEIDKGFFRLFYLSIFNESFPYFCFFEDEDFDDGAIRTKKLIKVIMGDDISKLIIDTHKKN